MNRMSQTVFSFFDTGKHPSEQTLSVGHAGLVQCRKHLVLRKSKRGRVRFRSRSYYLQIIEIWENRFLAHPRDSCHYCPFQRSAGDDGLSEPLLREKSGNTVRWIWYSVTGGISERLLEWVNFFYPKLVQCYDILIPAKDKLITG